MNSNSLASPKVVRANSQVYFTPSRLLYFSAREIVDIMIVMIKMKIRMMVIMMLNQKLTIKTVCQVA